MKILLLLIIVCTLVSCDVDELPEELPGNNPGSPPEAIPTAEPTPGPSNPVCTGQMGFNDGTGKNLWKPESDGDRKLVVLFDAKFKKEFTKCTAEFRDGSTDELYCNKGPWNDFSCFSNGDRLTMRGHRKGRGYKPNGVVTCTELKQTCNWKQPNDPQNRND